MYSCLQEVIPCLNDHMENTCSVELLEYMRKMVMSMIQQKHEAKVGVNTSTADRMILTDALRVCKFDSY